MTLSTRHLQEPLLEFGYNQKVEHPKDGLFLYGPIKIPGTPEVIRIGVVGTQEGVNLLKMWLTKISGKIDVEDPSKLYMSHWPGFQATFGARLETSPLVEVILSASQIDTAAKKSNRTDAVRSTVKLYEDAITEHRRNSDSFATWHDSSTASISILYIELRA